MKIDKLIESFENCTLPKEKWTHEAHLRVALYYIFYTSFYAALSKIRCGIIRYNASIEENNVCSEKYHETITIFWCIKVSDFIDSFTTEPFEEIEKKLLKSELSKSSFIKKFYSEEFLKTKKGRAYFVPKKDVQLP